MSQPPRLRASCLSRRADSRPRGDGPALEILPGLPGPAHLRATRSAANAAGFRDRSARSGSRTRALRRIAARTAAFGFRSMPLASPEAAAGSTSISTARAGAPTRLSRVSTSQSSRSSRSPGWSCRQISPSPDVPPENFTQPALAISSRTAGADLESRRSTSPMRRARSPARSSPARSRSMRRRMRRAGCRRVAIHADRGPGLQRSRFPRLRRPPREARLRRRAGYRELTLSTPIPSRSITRACLQAGGSATLDFAGDTLLPTAKIRIASLELANALPAYVQPFLINSGFKDITGSGTIRGDVEMDAGLPVRAGARPRRDHDRQQDRVRLARGPRRPRELVRRYVAHRARRHDRRRPLPVAPRVESRAVSGASSSAPPRFRSRRPAGISACSSR